MTSKPSKDETGADDSIWGLSCWRCAALRYAFGYICFADLENCYMCSCEGVVEIKASGIPNQ